MTVVRLFRCVVLFILLSYTGALAVTDIPLNATKNFTKTSDNKKAIEYAKEINKRSIVESGLRELKKELEQTKQDKQKPNSKNSKNPVMISEEIKSVPHPVANDIAIIERSEQDRQILSHNLAKDNKRLMNVLSYLINTTESMDDKERNYWYGKLPAMTDKQVLKLFDILSLERSKLADLERKYQQEIAGLNEKHIREGIEFQRKGYNADVPDTGISLASALMLSSDEQSLREAEDILRRIISKDITNASAYFALGNLYFKQGKLFDAEEAVLDAIRLKPDPEYFKVLGFVYVRQPNKEKAIKTFAEAIDLGLRDFKVFAKYGILLSESEMYEKAESALRKALELEGENTTVLRKLSLVLTEEGKNKEAEAVARKAVGIEPMASYNYFRLAWALYKQHKYDEAAKEFKKSFELETGDYNSMLMAVLSKVEEGKSEGIIQNIRRALELAQSEKAPKADEAEIRLSLAVLLARDKNIAKAKKILNAEAIKETQSCSSAYMKKERNWQDKMISFLERYKRQIGCP
jgi:tetratricopeptide (TPR) repeat protein